MTTDLKPQNITSQVRAIQQHQFRGLHAQTIPLPLLQQMIAGLIADPRGIGGLTFSIGNTAVPSQRLPQFLAENGLTRPQQLANVIYSLYAEIREKGTLTPAGADNLIHIDLQKLMSMARNEAIEVRMYNKSLTCQRTKNFDPLFAKDASPKPAKNLPPAVPYGLASNQNAAEIAVTEQAPAGSDDSTRVLKPKYLLGSVLMAYLPKPDIYKACDILFPKGGTA